MFGRTNPVYESMTRYTFCGWVVRVWREEPHWTSGPDGEVLELLNRIFVVGGDRNGIANAVAMLPRVAAVEILDPHGNGGLFYPDWK